LDRAPISAARLMVVGASVLWARSDREVVDLLKDGQLILVCSLGTPWQGRRAVARLSREAGRKDLSAGGHGKSRVSGL
jgi:hypothetical protein